MSYKVYVSKNNDDNLHPLPHVFDSPYYAYQVAAEYYNKGRDRVCVVDLDFLYGDEDDITWDDADFEIYRQPRPVKIYTEKFNTRTMRPGSKPHPHRVEYDDGRNWLDVWKFSQMFDYEVGDFTDEVRWCLPCLVDYGDGAICYKETCVDVYNGNKMVVYYYREPRDDLDPDNVAVILEWE